MLINRILLLLAFPLFFADPLLAGAGLVTAPQQASSASANDSHGVALSNGRAAFDQQNWGEAIRWFSGVLRRAPDNLEARYLRGVAYREAEKISTLHSNSLSDLSFVIERDSLYRDVLYQYALTLSYRNQYPDDFTKAIEIAEEQVRLKPEQTGSQIGLLSIYKAYIRSTRERKALRWLNAHNSDHARYFSGEVLRLGSLHYTSHGPVLERAKAEEADRIYKELLTRPAPQREMPSQPVLLARARIHYAQGEAERAEAFVEMAVASIDGELAARLVFEDFKHVLNKEEIVQFKLHHEPAGYQRFFETIWERRDPTPARTLNVRIAEHYRRLLKAEKEYVYLGRRGWANSPDVHRELELPTTHALSAEFDDRGVVYIRHGDPHDVVLHTGSDATAASWRYTNPDLDFHFESMGGGNWRFRPTPHPSLLLDPRQEVPTLTEITSWGSDYLQLARELITAAREGGEFSAFASLSSERVVENSRRSIREGLTMDRHSFAYSDEALDMSYMPVAFRGDDGRVDLLVYYSLEVAAIARKLGKGAADVDVEVGLALHSEDWTPLGSRVGTLRFPAGRDHPDFAVDVFRLSAVPDTYHVSIHGRSIQSDLLGAYRFGLRLPDFSVTELAMSDILPAHHAAPATDQSRFNQRGLYLEVNPARRFSTDQVMHVYFEIYNLTFDADDRTRYSIAYTFRSQEPRGLMRRVLGREDADVVLSLTTENRGETAMTVEHAEFDVQQLPPGSYELNVLITDQNVARRVARSISLELTK